MQIAIFQNADKGDAAKNIHHVHDAIVRQPGDFFVLPELFAMPGGDYFQHQALADHWRETGKPALEMLRDASAHFEGFIVGGSILERTPQGFYNTCFVFHLGRMVTKYRKIHITQDEVEMGILPGSEIVSFQTPFGRAGLMICADCLHEQTTDRIASGKTMVFLPTVALIQPPHSGPSGHPVSKRIAAKHGAVVVKVSRVGTYNGHPIAGESAVVCPDRVLFETKAKEELAVVDCSASLVHQGAGKK